MQSMVFFSGIPVPGNGKFPGILSTLVFIDTEATKRGERRQGKELKFLFPTFSFTLARKRSEGEKHRAAEWWVVYLDSRKRNSQRGNENGATNRRGYKLEQRRQRAYTTHREDVFLIRSQTKFSVFTTIIINIFEKPSGKNGGRMENFLFFFPYRIAMSASIMLS